MPPKNDAVRAAAPVQPLPAIPLSYGLPEPRPPLLGPPRVLPVDRAMAVLLLLLVGFTCLCMGDVRGGNSRFIMTFLVALCGSGYLLFRISTQPAVPVRLRVQLMVASLLCVASAFAAACIFFHPRYRGGRPVLRPYPPALYVTAAVLCLSAAWFAAVKWAVRREAGRGVPGAAHRKEEP